ncbi:DUF2062 domain-containing protein [Allosphingosinicella humi]|jgi:uncharacterized protein (DUF2062 family)
MADRLTLLERFHGWTARNMPTRETFARIGWLRPIAHRILLPELWRFHRRSVPRGVALGVIVGVLIPVAQTVFAAFLALPMRANVPVAALTTFITNPLTTPAIWVGGYWIGVYLLRVDAMTKAKPLNQHVDSQAVDWLQWLFSTAAPATALGLIVIAVVGAALGYLITSFGWKWWIGRKWRRRNVRVRRN